MSGLVPQSVRIDACLVDMSREFTFAAPDQAEAFPVPDRDRVQLGTVFDLSAEAIQQWASLTGDRLPAARVQIPNRLEERYEAASDSAVDAELQALMSKNKKS